MKFPLLISSREIILTTAIESTIREKAEKLKTFSDRIVNCRVTVCSPPRHHHKGNTFNIIINIKVPNAEIVVKREPREDLYVSIRDAFDAAKRQLKNYSRKQRGNVKLHDKIYKHPVSAFVRDLRLKEGYGFIETHEGREIYFHQNSVLNNRFKQLKVGAPVRFVEETGEKGPQASSITAI